MFEHVVRSQESCFRLPLKELWNSRDMLYFLVLRDFKIRFKQSYLGISWAILQPLLTTTVFTWVMGRILDKGFTGPYPLFFLSGLMAWSYFAKVMTNGTLSLVSEAELIKKVYFPRLILPIYQALSVFTDLLISLLMFLVLAWYYQWPLTGNIVFLPLFIIMAMLLSIGITLWLGPINVRFRDIQIVLPLFIQLLFMISPVMYPTSSLFSNPDSTMAFIYSLNPMAGIIEGFRFCLVGQGQPFAMPFLVAHLLVIMLFMSGVIYFNAQQRRFADVI